jgi:DNA replication protein DnaC
MTTTIETNALGKTLRTLKLSGMLATIDARLAQARAGELGHIEFLQVLCEDEISRRESMSMHRRLRKARFEEQATLEGFDFGASPKLPAAQIRDLAALRWLHARESVILYGPVGVGKSHIAQSLGHLAIRHGADVRFLKPAAPSHTSPAATPTTPGTSGSANSPGPPCSSSTTSRCANSPPPRPTTSTNSSPNEPPDL